MIIHDVQQSSPEWFKVRAGKITCSNLEKLFMGKSTKGYNDYINTLVYERLTNDIPESYESEWMIRGKELEGSARDRYELETFSKATQIGFVELDEFFGYSPDAFVGDNGLFEAKCPKHTTIIGYRLFPATFYKEYKYQCQGGLYATKREWIDLMAFHPKLEPIIQRIKVDEEIQVEIAKEVEIAKNLIQERIKIIKEKQ
ncbi:MAG: YqaJ viral recombinase family protein [Thermoplasmata archaeon]|nr:YqaJ viral recombinase family protein [Thermoplasmata archaeon]